MDTLLYQGDQKRDGRGFPVRIEGKQEKIQQALILLTMRRGAFRLAPELGSLFHQLGAAEPAHREELTLEYAREALMELEGVRVTKASCRQGGDGWNVLNLDLWLDCGIGEEVRVPITIQ